MIKNISFGGIYGAKRINHYRGSGMDSEHTLQDYHPFKNEFKSKEEEDKFISAHTQEGFDERNIYTTYTLNVKEELPFTKDEFNKMDDFKLDVLLLYKYPDILSTTYSESGFIPKEYLKERVR